ncbi:MAG TPA: hypothetical protein ENK43_10880 [Planctomycetes bacterium]|nr:hypothetical protein [Planctomycetota bacterium]
MVLSTSFPGFPAAAGAGLSPIFRDEVLLLTLDRAVDTTILGGLVTDGTGQLQSFIGVSSGATAGVPYHAFVDQLAAQQAFQVLNDAQGAAATPYAGVLGISTIDSNTLVFDPHVSPGNPFGLVPRAGFEANTQYDIFIPAGTALTAGGLPVGPFGGPPPQPVPPFTSPTPSVGTVFLSGPGFVPDTTPPSVVSVTTQFLSQNGLPNSTPIPHDDTIIVTFSEPVDPNSIDLVSNLVIRNTTLTTTASPMGVIVPVTQVSDAEGVIYSFTPTSFGPGPYTIRVEVGTNQNPANSILDLPAGSTGSQNALANSLVVEFTTESAPGQAAAASVAESFDSTAQQDSGFMPRYNPAEWNQVSGATGSPTGQLRGEALSGSPFGPSLGTRQQFSFQPQGAVPSIPVNCNTPTCPYTSPFDTDVHNLGFSANPMGGSHLMSLYLANGNELPAQLADSIELFEWAAPAGIASAISYPGFQMQMSHTTAEANFPSSFGLMSPYAVNFDFDNPQNEWLMPQAHPSPINPNLNEAPVLVIPSTTYTVGQFTPIGAFVPYPPLAIPFDFDNNRMEPSMTGAFVSPNLIVDIDIPPPVLEVNGNHNVVVGANADSPFPVRRLVGPSLAQPGVSGLPFLQDAARYHGRFTTVNKNSSARTVFIDVGATTMNPDYTTLSIFPPIANRPPGTAITVRIEGADMVNSNMGVGSTGTLTYVTRNGVVQSDQLDLLDGKRFVRVTFEFESDVTNNVVPFINSFLLGYDL